MDNEELIQAAKTFRSSTEGAGHAPANEGSMIGLWLATADALEKALADLAYAESGVR